MNTGSIIQKSAARTTAAVAKAQARPAFSVAINTDSMKKLINNTLNDPKQASEFVTNCISMVSRNPVLANCDASSIVSAALTGKTLNLPFNLGFWYVVPFEDRRNNRTTATFQLGYKGMIQLAIKSGFYKKLNVLAIKKGEFKHYDPMTEEIEVELIHDDDVREKTETVGYYAFYEYLNGFRKSIYWTREKCEAHAEKYSKGYSAHKGFTFWEKSFDDMACKTVLRQLLSKWGLMSTELQTAFENEVGKVMNANGGLDIVADEAQVETIEVPSEVETTVAPEEPQTETKPATGYKTAEELINED